VALCPSSALTRHPGFTAVQQISGDRPVGGGGVGPGPRKTSRGGQVS
jgi:hypothetical protein